MALDSEIEWLSLEAALKKSKSHFIQVIEEKNREIYEKNSSIKEYVDKIVALESEINELKAEGLTAKENSHAWLKKAGELVGAIKDLEAHATQVSCLKGKLNKSEEELEAQKKISASLLSGGITTAEVLAKCHEAEDTAKKEKSLREQSESNLRRFFNILEGQADIIMDERMIFDRMGEAYDQLFKKLQNSQGSIQDAISPEGLLNFEDIKGLIKEKAELQANVRDLTQKIGSNVRELQTLRLLLEEANDRAKKVNEVNAENTMLHDQVEALHIKLANVDDGGLQNMEYLRRSKELAEILSAAQDLWEDSRSVHFTDDEFKALQVQVSEMNLLRESAVQLREEKKRSLEECHTLNVKVENLQHSLGERENEVAACKSEIETLKVDREKFSELKAESEQHKSLLAQLQSVSKELVMQKNYLTKKSAEFERKLG